MQYLMAGDVKTQTGPEHILTVPIKRSFQAQAGKKKTNTGQSGEEKAGTEVPVIFDYNEMCQA